ncbi:CDK2-associated and cullin domain-containing protein 1-like [Liolophura sinensis]|uniref:CDK2-associated and cullin domain-containing protein 1-like n=1 Tax=Liolophura sinensis TaxID=3198878 RepID=UPI0031588A5B
MDEPMEENIADSTQSEPPDDKKKQNPSILRPGSMVMMTLTVEDYETHYWPKLESAMNQLLTMTPGGYIPISYEQMYSCVYKCVCKQFSERLYADLLRHITSHLDRLNVDLENSKTDVKSYVEKFAFAMNQYLQALSGIVPIFNYMNRFYVETKLKTDLHAELQKIFTSHVAKNHINFLLPLLEEVSSHPFLISPPTMATMIKNLHLLNKEFAQLKPQLFAKYIPNVLPATSEKDLERYIQETKEMQSALYNIPEFHRLESQKRPNEEESVKPVPVVNYPRLDSL